MRSGSLIAAVALAAVATVLLVAAVFIDEVPAALREWMGFDNDKDAKAAATSWARWTFVALALALVLLARRWDRVVWPEVALAFLVSVAVGAGAEAHYLVNHPEDEPDPPLMEFRLEPAEVPVTVLGDIDAGGEAVVLVVEPEKEADNKPLSYTSTRYAATATAAAAAGTPSGEVHIAVERGEEDANASAFSGDLEGAVRVYVAPRE
jgi:hypothetical protein